MSTSCRDARSLQSSTAIEIPPTGAVPAAWVEEPVPPENLAALKKAPDIRIPVRPASGSTCATSFAKLFELQAANHSTGHYPLRRHLETKKLPPADAYYVLSPRTMSRTVSTAATCIWPVHHNFKIQEHFNDSRRTSSKRSAG